MGGVEVLVLDGTPEPFEKMISPYLIVVGDEAIMIDSGSKSSAQLLLSQVEEAGARLRYIILTHIHLDHGGGAGTLYRESGTVEKVYVHPRGVKHLIDPERLWRASKELLGPYAEYYGRPDPLPEEAVEGLRDEEELELLGVRVRVLFTPGHASHHVSLYLEGERILFTGDSAGVSVVDDDGVTRVEVPTNPPPFKPDLYYQSLKRMINVDPKPAKVALGHYGFHPEGYEYLLRHEKEVLEWFRAALEAGGSESLEPERMAAILAGRLGQAERAFNAGNPVIREFFYMGAVLGLLDAMVRGEKFPGTG